MVFKRKKKRTTLKILKSFFLPERGWRRAIEYLTHRIKRLPDTPHRIALGLSFGVFASFSPLFGFHFLIGVLLAYIFSGNVFASIMGTFFANPITFPFIATASVRVGNIILEQLHIRDNYKITNELWQFNSKLTSFGMFEKFLFEVYFDKFVPYAVGGIICGLVAAFCIYFLSKPLIISYQKRRRRKNKYINKIH